MKKKITKNKDNKYLVFIWCGFAILLLATLIAEHTITIHPLFSIDGRMFFHAWFGLVMCTIIILFSKILGLFIKRNEDYYKEGGNDN